MTLLRNSGILHRQAQKQVSKISKNADQDKENTTDKYIIYQSIPTTTLAYCIFLSTHKTVLINVPVRFESEIGDVQFVNINKILNNRAAEQSSPSYMGAPTKYTHSKDIDYLYDSVNGDRNSKIRVTVDGSDGDRNSNEPQIKRCIQKRRLANLEISCPNQPFDYRISISTETIGIT